LGLGLGLAFFKDLSDKNAHHKLVYNVDRWITFTRGQQFHM